MVECGQLDQGKRTLQEGDGLMTKKAPKDSVVAFKVEADLAQFLNGLPNKSDFIRRAVYAQLGVACPLCKGSGNVSKETHDQFKTFLARWDLHQCTECGDEFALPKQEVGIPENLKPLVERMTEEKAQYCFTCVDHPHDK